MPSKKKRIEKERNKPLADILRELYKGNQASVARELGTTQPTISRWMRECQLIRSAELSRQSNNGEKHGISN